MVARIRLEVAPEVETEKGTRRIWAPLEASGCTVRSLRKRLCKLVGVKCPRDRIFLSADGYRLLPELPVDVVRDGDLVRLEVEGGTTSQGAAVRHEQQTKEARSRSAKRKAIKRAIRRQENQGNLPTSHRVPSEGEAKERDEHESNRKHKGNEQDTELEAFFSWACGGGAEDAQSLPEFRYDRNGVTIAYRVMEFHRGGPQLSPFRLGWAHQEEDGLWNIEPFPKKAKEGGKRAEEMADSLEFADISKGVQKGKAPLLGHPYSGPDGTLLMGKGEEIYDARLVDSGMETREEGSPHQESAERSPQATEEHAEAGEGTAEGGRQPTRREAAAALREWRRWAREGGQRGRRIPKSAGVGPLLNRLRSSP